ncbi:MAG: phenylalanine--tRNA ligase subunit alpha [Pelolinea sp.]|nr:phenylalanine--tRNA ligase subunit alpha [Pelolinea sp.]
MEMLKASAEAELRALDSEEALARWKSTYLGKSSPLSQIFKHISKAEKGERAKLGQLANQVKSALKIIYEERAEALRQATLNAALASERLDVTLPGRPVARGRLHIATQTLREIYHIFAEMGFQIYRSPEVESEEYNFELLNIPAYHPARDMWDTFFTKKEGVLLRTHTSPGQIRAMREFAPEPVRVLLPGMCYRYEQTDASHEFQFNQVELLAVGKGITFANMKGSLEQFAERMFGNGVRTRFRPSYFPFVEPGGEMDVECFVCSGKGCSVCKQRGWLEILGCGMVHPIVLENGGYDPNKYSGFAAGLGPERIAMLRYRINDIRNFWANDLRFLEQF